MKKEEFLQILQDDEIREAILHIVREEGDAAVEPVMCRPILRTVNDTSKREIEKLQALLEQEQEWCDGLVDKNKALEMQLQQEQRDKEIRIKNEERLQSEKLALSQSAEKAETLLQKREDEIKRLEDSLAGAEHQLDVLQVKLEEGRRTYETAEKKHAEEKQRLLEEAASMQEEKQRLEQRKNALEKANHALQMQLEERFGRGWELFEQYRNVSEYTKKLLHNGVFTQEGSFMSFICGGAQTTSLDRLWEALRDCLMRRQQKDAEILWDIFEYCLELVNASRTQAKYEILPVKEGDTFDPDCHMEGPDSKAQGTVCGIYLRGYRNTYGDKIMKKSIVQVG